MLTFLAFFLLSETVAKDSDSKGIFDDDIETTSSDQGPKIQEEWLQKITSDVSGVQNYYLTALPPELIT